MFSSLKDYPAITSFMVIIVCSVLITVFWHFKNKSSSVTYAIIPLSDMPDVYQKINGATGALKCPIAIEELVYLKLPYWGFDHKAHVGVLIVNKALATDLVEIFIALYQNKFPIEQMRPIHEFHNDDTQSMEANNTSAFNCREITGQPGLFSQHSYGRAVDINPKINPYVKKESVLPESGRPYVNRNQVAPGKITRSSLIYTLFTERGWDWGGHWNDLQDYQHFEKRANGEKRNPQGYAAHG